MLASKALDQLEAFHVLHALRRGTIDILHIFDPDIDIQQINDFPYLRAAELSKTVPASLLATLRERHCECLSYGNAAKSETGEGVSAVVVRF